MEFFLRFYEFLEEDLVRVIEESRVFGRIVVAFNTTFIALISKFTIHLDLTNACLFPCPISFIRLYQI
jgi:hypothetical protein